MSDSCLSAFRLILGHSALAILLHTSLSDKGHVTMFEIIVGRCFFYVYISDGVYFQSSH